MSETDLTNLPTALTIEVDRVHRLLRTIWQEHDGHVSDVEWTLRFLPVFYDMAHAMIADRYSIETKMFLEQFPVLYTPTKNDVISP